MSLVAVVQEIVVIYKCDIIYMYTCLQPIMAIFRPAPDAGNRWIFNMFHFTVGFLAQLASGMRLLHQSHKLWPAILANAAW